MLELAALFATSFAAATLVPLPSEAALYAYLQAHPGRAALAVTVATLGNTAGGMTTYLLGRFVPRRRIVSERAMSAARRYGAPILLLAWLPVVGDALCAAAGWLRLNAWTAAACMAAGRLARYIAVASLA